MARVWNNVTNLELLKNRTILQLLKNQDDLLKEFALEIDRIEGVANTAVGTANNALSVATTARAESTAALQTAQAANAKSDEAKADAADAKTAAQEAKADAADAKTAAQNAANAAVAAQGSAAGAENSAGQAANSAAAAAADAAKVNQLETKVNKNTSDISTINEDLAASRLAIGAIEAREAGYGKSLSISGNSLSLMHDANTLSTVTIPGGGSEIVARPLTGWKVQNQTTSLDITNAYYVPISDNIWYVCGKLLHATALSGNVGVRIIPPDAWGTPALVIGEVAIGKTSNYTRTLPIISQPSGTSADVIGVVPTPITPGGLVKYDGESLYSFFFMAIRNAGV